MPKSSAVSAKCGASSRRVVWPTKSQIVNNVIIVLVCCLIVGACIWIFDAIVNLFVQGIISLVKG